MTYLEAGIEVIKLLESNGYEAYFVGGFVRDYLLGEECNDIDIATNALPGAVSTIFNVNKTGILYNCVTINYEGYKFETTTYRKEISYNDNRHPVYEVTNTLLDDLKRRDFTVNAMAMDKDLKLIDVFFGLDDLKNKLIKTVFEPQKRFTEDALRMLRAAYFAAKLDFKIADDTLLGMKKCSYLVQNLSNDRICWELEKIINTKHQIIGFKYLIETNIAPYLLQFKNAIYLAVEKNITFDWPLFIAISYYDNPDEIEFLHLKSSLNNQLVSAIKLSKELKKNTFTKDILFDYPQPVLLLANDLNVILNKCKDQREFILKEYPLLKIHSLSDLAINGNDIIENITVKDNKIIKEILLKLKHLVLNNKLENTKESLINFIKKHY